MATALTVGGWSAQATIQTLVDRLSSSAIQAYTSQSGLGDALSSLERSLLKVNVVLAGSQERLMKEDENLNKLLKQLKESAYDAEDLIDELEYENLKLKMEGEGNQSSGILPVELKFARGFLDDNTTKVWKVHKKLNDMTADLKEVLPNDSGKKQVENDDRERPEMGSLLEEQEVVGRAREKHELIHLLLNEDTYRSNYNRLQVVSVVGIGGVGKTTLAQIVYNSRLIEQNFHVKIWISASDPFDVKRLTKELVGDGDLARPELANLDRLQMIVKKKLSGKRFLLVMDDVWNENRSKWERFCVPLRYGEPGSKILVTCRSRKVAETIGADDIYYLKGLEDDLYWQFFKKCAFGYEDSKNYVKLETIGKMIAARLKGNPLAAETVGSLLNSNLDEEHWTTVMESEIWDLKQDEKDILPVLKLSYDYLSPCLKQCFAYCSLFPKNFVFEKDTLVQMWMAQGFVTSHGKLMEDVGRGYLEELLSREFFEQHPCDDGKMMMHDLLHDLAQSIFKDECYWLDDGKPHKIPRTVYHLSVCDPNIEPHVIIDICNQHKKLRTLLFVRGATHDLSVELDQLLSGLTCMRVLELKGRCTADELPGSIGNLKRLRYLDVSRTNVQKLPESLCRLYNLQVLKLDDRCKIRFPKGMTNMISLRHLSAKESSVITIANIGRLTSLQNPRLFSIRKEHGYMIEELKNMIELRGNLRIEHLENIDSKEEASRAKLDNKKYLKKLWLEWAYERHTDLGIEISDAAILEGLRPHSNLEKLKIVNYGCLQCPSWLEPRYLPNLVRVSLIDCKCMVQLPPLGQLPYLKLLELRGLNAVKEVGGELYGTTQLKAFRSLKTLVFRDMPELGEWSGACGSHLFPCLVEVSICNCPKLRNLPCLPSSLIKLELHEVGLDALPGIWVDDVSHLSEVDVRNCPNLKSLEECLLPNQLLYLKSMSISDCGELTSLPLERFKDLTCLLYLTLKNCPKLTYAIEAEEEQNNDLVLLFPSSLEEVVLDCCGDLDRALLLCLRGATSLRRLVMADCEHITSLPGGFGLQATKLEYLRLEGLNGLKTLESLQCFTSLIQLLIKDCPQLKAMPEDSLPSSLKFLVISNCHPDLKERCQKDIGDDWPKIAHIRKIIIDGDVDYLACYFMSRSNNYWLGGRGLKKKIQYR